MPSSNTSCHPETLDARLNELQHALFRVLKSLVFRGDPNSPLVELPISQLRCLHVIAEQEGLKMLEVSHKLEVKLPALSQIVGRLVKRGMVERRADPADRRVVRLGLTAQARAVLAEANAARQARMSATRRNLDDRAVRIVIEGLTLLAEAAERVEAAEREAAPPFSPDSDPFVELMSRRARTQRRSAAPEMSPPGSGEVNRSEA